MFISSKCEDIYPLRLSLVAEKIGHNKFSGEEIKESEISILEALNFCLNEANTYDFVSLILSFLNLINFNWDFKITFLFE